MSINYLQPFVSQNPTVGTTGTGSSAVLGLDDAYVYNISGRSLACRFVMSKTTQALTAAYFFGNNTGGSPGDIITEVRNAESIEFPGTTLLASDTVTLGSNWHTADFSASPPTLTSGELYFISFGESTAGGVFAINRGGSISSTDNWGDFFKTIFSTDGWNVNSFTSTDISMVVLKFADGSVLGNPYGEDSSVYSSNTLERGFKIVNLPYDMTVYGVNFASGTDTMEAIKIYEDEDLPTDTPVFTHTLDVSEKDTSTQVLFAPFTFVANKTYRLVSSWDSASTGPGYFEIPSAGGNQDLLDAGYASGFIYETIETGGVWTDNTDRFPQAGLLLAGAGTDSVAAITTGIIESDLITRSRPLFQLGTLVTQIAPFTGSKTLHKASIDLTVTNADATTFVVGSDGIVSFQAANFYEGRDTWVFHPVLHWSASNNWETSGLSIENLLQTEGYSTSATAATSAPFLTYRLFLDVAGVYNLWGFGFTSGGVFWSWDGDTSDMRQFTLGTPTGPPQWTKFGSIESTAGGVHTFSVYLSDAGTAVMDQWYFTTDTADLTYPFVSKTLSKSHFTTGIRVRSLNDGSLDDLEGPSSGSQRAVAWMPSKNTFASGKYNYELQNNDSGSGVTFQDGASIDIWQTGGNFERFASWDFAVTDSPIGDAFVSTDYGETFTQES